MYVQQRFNIAQEKTFWNTIQSCQFTYLVNIIAPHPRHVI